MPKEVPGGRIRKVGPRRPHVDGATLRAPGKASDVDDRAPRRDIPKDSMTLANIREASTLSLLRVRARNVRGTYERMWRCYEPCEYRWEQH